MERNDTIIRAGDDTATLINVFDVAASRQQATIADPEARSYAERAAVLARATPHVYSVVSVHHA